MEKSERQDYCDVSVIIPHYNNFKDLGRAVRSVLEQSLQPIEIIIVDDASIECSDRAVFFDEFNVLMEKKYLIFHQLEKNGGASFARNVAVSLAKGDYLAFLDSDDIWHPQKLEIQYLAMKSLDITFSYHRYIVNLTDEAGVIHFSKKQDIHHPKLIQQSRNKFIITNPIATPTVMLKRDTFVSFDIELRRMEDYECWVRYSKHNRIYFLDTSLSAGFKRSIGQSGLSQDVHKMHIGLVLALYRLYSGGFIGFWFFMCAVVLEYIKFPIRLLKVKLYD